MFAIFVSSYRIKSEPVKKNMNLNVPKCMVLMIVGITFLVSSKIVKSWNISILEMLWPGSRLLARKTKIWSNPQSNPWSAKWLKTVRIFDKNCHWRTRLLFWIKDLIQANAEETKKNRFWIVQKIRHTDGNSENPFLTGDPVKTVKTARDQTFQWFFNEVIGKTILEQFSRKRFYTRLENRGFFPCSVASIKRAGISNPVKNRVLETWSNNFFPLVLTLEIDLKRACVRLSQKYQLPKSNHFIYISWVEFGFAFMSHLKIRSLLSAI